MFHWCGSLFWQIIIGWCLLLGLLKQSTALQCYECQEVYNVDGCSLSANCGQDEVCFTRRFINFRGREAYRMGCENVDVCSFYRRTAIVIGRRAAQSQHAPCRQCCYHDNCNDRLCLNSMTVPRTTTSFPPRQTSTITPLSTTASSMAATTLTAVVTKSTIQTASTTPTVTPSTSETVTLSTRQNLLTSTLTIGSSPTTGGIQVRRDCMAYMDAGITKSGIYLIRPDGRSPFAALCDLVTDGGGWTIIQRRFNGSQSFHQNWDVYKSGFGSLNGEFWLGNEFIHRITSQPGRHYQLRFELQAQNGTTFYAEYSNVVVSSEAEKYKITFDGYEGNAGDSFSVHKGMKFSTYDSDNDIGAQHCARLYKGGWWYHKCYDVNINGVYGVQGDAGLVWYFITRWRHSLIATSMAVRPKLTV